MPEPSRRCLPLLAVLISGCTTLGMPAGSPVPSTVASAPPAATPIPTATPTPSPTPTANATPIPDPAALDLEVIGCDGGVVLDWSASTHPQFHHYTALRSPEREIAPAYPPIAPAVDWGDTYATDPFVTSAVDASILPSASIWNYRVMAYDDRGRVVSSSPVRSAQMIGAVELGALTVSAAAGLTRLEWEPYGGIAGCFSSYRVLSGIGEAAPGTVLNTISDQSAASLETDALHAGTAYRLRVEAVRVTNLGSFVVGQTEIATYTVP